MSDARLDGVLVVDKPPGMTSAHVVARVKRVLHADRVGHTGTLDPMATGVLPIVLGEATKLAGYLLADDKVYDGELELGFETDTLDVEGQVLRRSPVPELSLGAIEEALARLTGEIDQIPPMYSALKHEGKRLHELARKGEEVDRAPRRIRIDRFVLQELALPRLRIEVACSKGTYVRSLVRDLGALLGCGATLTALRRTRSGRFSLAEAVPLETVGQGSPRLVGLADAVDNMPSVRLDADDVVRARQGKRLPAPLELAPGTVVRLLDGEGALVAIVEVREGLLVVLRGFR